MKPERGQGTENGVHVGMPVPSSGAKLDWLQALRGISAVSVLLFHTRWIAGDRLGQVGMFQIFAFGHAGVDMFFVISGYIIFRVHAKDLGSPARFGSFLWKRAVRIYPIYWILMTGVVAGFLAFPGLVNEAKQTWGHVFESYSLFPVGWAHGLPIIPPAWSLFHEVKFYLFFAAMILLPARGRYLGIGLAVLLTLMNTLAQTGLGPEALPWSRGEMPLFWVHPFNLLFLFGWAVAYGQMTSQPRAAARLCTGLGIAGLLLTGGLDVARSWDNDTWRTLAYGLSATLLVMGATLPQAGPRRAPRWLVFLGDASYSIYLVHWLVYETLTLLVIKTGAQLVLGVPTVTLGIFAIAVGVGCLFHAWVERPLLVWGRGLPAGWTRRTRPAAGPV